ncbi:putative intraflagellar transport protein IFT88, partial [Trypanosoma grayi]|uniref:putative intraflagellar transport protein IFT88 n=1 Tax=Trypanosoma grayi TaxID=71804 RepID=UPI0004F46D81
THTLSHTDVVAVMRKGRVELLVPPIQGEKSPAALPPAAPVKEDQQQKQQGQLVLAPTKPPPRVGHNAISLRPARPRESLISKSQRDALTVSAFGFGTTRHGQPDQSAESVKNGLATAAGDIGSIVVSQSEKDSLRFHLCVDALAEGCITTFIHLFRLSHRDPVCVDQLAQTHFTIPDASLRWVRDQLAAVEVLRRQSEFRDVYERCRALAEYFEGERDYAEAACHYDTALRY